MTPRLTIGIDPGQSGGIAVLCGQLEEASKMPETEKDMVDLLREYAATAAGLGATAFCYLEAVHSMPGQGVASSFKFGKGYGALIGALLALGIPFETVTPQKWQKELGCLTKGDKNVSKRKAQQLFPNIKITHATADSLLIAQYGRRQTALYSH